MKKLLKSRIFFFILGALIFGSIVGVSATILYQADQVGFTPSNPNWNVNNLEDALNDLYSNSSNCVSGSFICTTCTSSSGQLIENFEPKTFVVRWKNDDLEIIHYYNKEINSNYWYSWERTITNNAYYASMGNIIVTERYIKDSKFILHSFSNMWLNKTIYYMACK